MRIVVLGATSGIAQEVVKIYASRGAELVLVARSSEKLEVVAKDALTRGAKEVSSLICSFESEDSCRELVLKLTTGDSKLDLAFLAFGDLPDQIKAQQSWNQARSSLQVNLLSPIYILGELANLMEMQKEGVLAVIGSVAGDRGRKSNYIYGTAKGGLAIFLQGLRNRLSASGVHVLTIKPGFVDTPMTAHLKKGVLFAKADSVATGIVKAIDEKKDVVYLPFFWFGIMSIICSIPERIFKRLSL